PLAAAPAANVRRPPCRAPAARPRTRPPLVQQQLSSSQIEPADSPSFFFDFLSLSRISEHFLQWDTSRTSLEIEWVTNC
ncbi:hypothetical protein LINPERPRIM_LOCUS10034, partial [Linum perenne]